LGLNYEDSGYEVVSAFGLVDAAETDTPNSLRAGRNGYLLDLFS